MTTAVSDSDAPAVGSPGSVSRRALRRRARRAATGLAADLYLWESLVALRVPWTLSTFRLVVCAAGAVVCLLVWTLSAVVANALLDLADPELSLSVIAATVLAFSYLAAAHVARDILSGLNPVTRNDPRHALLTALDLPLTTVALVYTAAPRLPLALAGSGAVAALCLPLREQTGLAAGDVVLLSTMPVLLGIAGAAIAATAAVAQRGRRLPTVRILVGLGVASIALGWASGKLVSTLSLDDSATKLEPRAVVGWMLPEAILLIALTLISVLVLHRSRADQIALTTAAPRTRTTDTSTLRTVLVRGLLAEIIAAPTFPVIRNTIVGSLCGVMILLGAGLAGLSFASLPATHVNTVMLSIIATLVLALCEALSRPVGPIRLALLMRSLWELGASRHQLAVAMLGTYGVVVGSSLVLTSVAYGLVTGSPSAAPALAHLLGLAAWVVAECVVPPLTNADGSAMYNAVTGVAIATMTAPVLLVVLRPGSSVFALLGVYSLILTGGAFSCLSKRVLRMPSVSAR